MFCNVSLWWEHEDDGAGACEKDSGRGWGLDAGGALEWFLMLHRFLFFHQHHFVPVRPFRR